MMMMTPVDSPDVPVFDTALAGLRVLVVDDTPDTLEMLTLLLELYGAEVRAAASAAEARASYSAERPDVIVSDISMPGESGLELIANLRKADLRDGRRPVPAIALTGVAEVHPREALAAGFQDHLKKPADPTRLVRAIVRLLDPSQ